jgi:hypothetical protein
MAGDAAHPVSQAPGHCPRAGAERLVADKGVLAGVQRVDIRPAARDDVATAAAVSRVLRMTVRQAVTAGQLPIVPGRIMRCGNGGCRWAEFWPLTGGL